MEFFIILLAAVAVFGFKSFVVIPQQEVHVVERLGRFHRALTAGLNILIPFIDRVAYRHSLKEIPLDVPSQVCITRDNTQLTVDGIIYFQVTDPKLASYGSSNYIMAITQLAQTTLRSVIGRMELDKTFEERDEINSTVVAALDEAAGAWGVNAEAIRQIAAALQTQGGADAVNLKIAEQYVAAFNNLAKESNTLIMPANVADIGSLISAGMKIIDSSKTAK